MLDTGLTEALRSAMDDEEATPLPHLLEGQKPAADAWQDHLWTAYGITRSVWSALASLTGLLARPWKVVLRSRHGVAVGRSRNARASRAQSRADNDCR